ncbi:MAG: hypothetical protein A2X49_04460 [Lentisphaerae bacterium GWF2_52_8]|nr:MAG: hypothetical protein A2X49_04460 [Lentisphaerae bacterium GWF2_52_8]
MKKILTLLVFVGFTALCLLAISGCTNSVNSTENADKVMVPDPVNTKKVILDDALSSRLSILSVDSQTLPGGELKVQVSLRSNRVGFWAWLWHGNRTYRVSYRFHWFNEKGMRVDTANSVWLEKEILPGEAIWLSSVAPNASCKDFQLQLKEL